MTPTPKMTVDVLSLRENIIQSYNRKENDLERTGGREYTVCGILVKESAFREFLDWLMSGTRKFQFGKSLQNLGHIPHKLNENAETLMW